MQKLGLQAKGTPRRYRKTHAPSYQEKANLLDRIFTVNDKNSVWVGDITYIPTKQGFLHLAVMIDLYSRKVVGWSMSSGMSERLATGALKQAIGRENPAAGLIVHTDRGSQYTSKAFQKALGENGFTHSMSRKGNPYYNAVSESFFRTLKRELVKGAAFEDRLVAQQAIFKYIELYYNTRRMHSSLGYKSPLEYERQSA
jgi:putative transposase